MKTKRFPTQIGLADSRAARMLEGGNVTITVKSKKTGQHITISFASRKVRDDWNRDRPTGRKWVPVTPLDPDAQIFIEAGAGDKIGTLSNFRAIEDGEQRWSYRPPYVRGQRYGELPDPARMWAAVMALEWLCGNESPLAEFTESEECGRCKRALTDPVSIERGIGPECYAKVTGSQHQRKAAAAQMQLRERDLRLEEDELPDERTAQEIYDDGLAHSVEKG